MPCKIYCRRTERKMLCRVCLKEFKSSRKDAKTCGPTCRQQLSRFIRSELSFRRLIKFEK